MKTIILTLALLALISAFEHKLYTDEELLDLMIEYGYYPDVNSPRFALFKQRAHDIQMHNSNPHKKFARAINKFAFYTQEEINKQTNFMAAQDCSATAEWTMSHNERKSINVKDLPKSVDWRKQDKVTGVKDQGQCGSCWTFSTTGAMEAHWAIAMQTSAATLLSEQQLVDCAGDFNNFGCNGGLPSQAFEYIYYNVGLDTEASYPYEAQDNDCRFNPDTVGATIKGGVYNVTFQNEDELQQVVANNGPVSIAFQVINDFFSYTSGIYTTEDCSTGPKDVNHAVLVVGYDETSDGSKYWIVKNSWGESWGDEGYFWIERGTNMCGLSDCASFPLILAQEQIESQF